MKKIILSVLGLALIFAVSALQSCSQDEDAEALTTQKTEIKKGLTVQEITKLKSYAAYRGIYLNIDNSSVDSCTYQQIFDFINSTTASDTKCFLRKKGGSETSSFSGNSQYGRAVNVCTAEFTKNDSNHTTWQATVLLSASWNQKTLEPYVTISGNGTWVSTIYAVGEGTHSFGNKSISASQQFEYQQTGWSGVATASLNVDDTTGSFSLSF